MMQKKSHVTKKQTKANKTENLWESHVKVEKSQSLRKNANTQHNVKPL